MNYQESGEEREALRAALAIECHKVRVWLGAHPGSTGLEIRNALQGRTDMCLAKMLSMGIVKVWQEKAPDGRRLRKWSVIPQ